MFKNCQIFTYSEASLKIPALLEGYEFTFFEKGAKLPVSKKLRILTDKAAEKVVGHIVVS